MEYPNSACNLKDIPVDSDVDEWNRQVLQHVYGSLSSTTHLSLENVQEYIYLQLESSVASSPQLAPPPRDGRLGPERVTFCLHASTGSMILDGDFIGVCRETNFGTVKANCCVYSGRWQYEVMLITKGIMQVGWATMSCKFSQESGVGDTPNSYSFDGGRVKKWNVIESIYGSPWLAGDIIGCTIDLNKGEIHYYRNGSSLGEAFSNIKLGPGIAYFPAVSLANTECLVANFGARPFRFPVDGFVPLEQEPHDDVIKAEKIFTWLERFLIVYDDSNDNTNSQLLPVQHDWMELPEKEKKPRMLLLVAPLLRNLGSLLKSAYVTETCLLQFLFKLCHIEPLSFGSVLPELNTIKQNSRVSFFLDILWTLLESSEVTQCLENLIVSLMYGYRFSLSTADFYVERCYLLLVVAILQHEKTCRYLLDNNSFRLRFPMFMDIKSLDSTILEEVVPIVWYPKSDETVQLLNNDKASYKMSCSRLGASVNQLTSIQDQILLQLFRPPTVQSTPSRRSIFLPILQEFVRRNSWGTRSFIMHNSPHLVTLGFFHRLVTLVRNQIKVSCDPKIDEPNLAIPVEIFYSESVSYHDPRRIGGFVSDLKMQYQEELKELLQRARSGVEFLDTSEQPGSDHRSRHYHPNAMENTNEELDDYKVTVYLLDSIILLYFTSAHSRLEKMRRLSDSMQKYMKRLKDLENVQCEDDFQEHVEKTKNAVVKKLTNLSRHLAWASEVLYSKEARDDIHWLWQITLRTLQQASDSGLFYAFIPTFYIETCINFFQSVRAFLSTAIPVDGLEYWSDILVQFGSFLVNNLVHSHITDAGVKETLVHSFASFASHSSTLRLLENMPSSIHQTMANGLLQSYNENRSWKQSNWILVRFWKGCGFAFRYVLPPDLKSKGDQDSEIQSSKRQRPCPSPILQRQIACWLWDNPDSASSFLSSILTQINYNFSEFTSKAQDIHITVNRCDSSEIDSMQLVSCASRFEISIDLLRVLEMVVSLQPGLVTNNDRPSAETLLTRLCQLICQILNRVTSKTGCFQVIVNMEFQALKPVQHFTILAAVAGIIISLTNNGSTSSRETAIKALISEPSYQPDYVSFLLPKKGMPSNSAGPTFSFDNFSEVSNEEKEQLKHVINTLHLQHEQVQLVQATSVIDEESLCTICYANPVSATFLPCKHKSCQSCISLHLVNQRDCFFCKCFIKCVTASNGEVIYPTAHASE